MLKIIRRLHLYLGCFFTPLLLFFVLSGWYQTVNPERLKSPSEAESLAQKLRTVHVDQIYPSEYEIVKPSNPKFFQWLIISMSLAATVTMALGVVLAFRTLKKKWLLWLCLVAGFLVPMMALWLGRPSMPQ